MDAHYDQVMKAREQSTASPSKLYFAYSTVLDSSAFEEWKGQHNYGFFNLPMGEVVEAVNLKLVFDFPSRWWGGRVAGLTDAPGTSVFGMLYEIAGQDWPIIRHKEGAVTGMCVERPVSIKRKDSHSVLNAVAFTTNPQRASAEGEISSRFMEALLRGLEAAGLPERYRDSVRATGAGK